MGDHSRQLDRVIHLPVVQTPGRRALALKCHPHAPSTGTRPYDFTLGRTGSFSQRVELPATELVHQVSNDLDRDGDHLGPVDALERAQAGKDIGANAEFARRPSRFVRRRDPVPMDRTVSAVDVIRPPVRQTLGSARPHKTVVLTTPQAGKPAEETPPAGRPRRERSSPQSATAQRLGEKAARRVLRRGPLLGTRGERRR